MAEYNYQKNLKLWRLGSFGFKTPDKISYYYLKDHIGNIRVTVNEQGDIVTKDDYYPFGLRMPGLSYNNGNQNDRLKFQSKRLQDYGNWRTYYFGWRDYDRELGRWFVVDPARQFASPYVAMANNPVLFYDLDGMITWKGILASIGINIVGITTFILTDGHFGFVGYWDDEKGEWNIYGGGWGSKGIGFLNIGGDKNGMHAFGQYFWDPNPPNNNGGVDASGEMINDEKQVDNPQGIIAGSNGKINNGGRVSGYNHDHYAILSFTVPYIDAYTGLPVYSTIYTTPYPNVFYHFKYFADGSPYYYPGFDDGTINWVAAENLGAGALKDPGLLDPIDWIPFERALSFGRYISNTYRIVPVSRKGPGMLTKYQIYNKTDDYFWQLHKAHHGRWIHWQKMGYRHGKSWNNHIEYRHFLWPFWKY